MSQIPPPFHVPDPAEGDPPPDPDGTPDPNEPTEGDEGYKMPPPVPPAEIKEPRISGV
jgi:hypothetical protein